MCVKGKLPGANSYLPFLKNKTNLKDRSSRRKLTLILGWIAFSNYSITIKASKTLGKIGISEGTDERFPPTKQEVDGQPRGFGTSAKGCWIFLASER